MVNKIIHYCWFGKNPLPIEAIECIESWKAKCPDYEIVEWNESNFDIHFCKYCQLAYDEKKFAFVSDVARYWIMYNYGGVYLDVDVELIRNIDELLEHNLMGFEDGEMVNPGLIMAMEPKNLFCKKILDYYISLNDFTINHTVVNITTDFLKEQGLIQNDSFQIVDDIAIYPTDFFNPKGKNYGKVKITKNTYSIHHYNASWKTKKEKILQNYRSLFGRKLGTIIFSFVHPVYALKKKRGKI